MSNLLIPISNGFEEIEAITIIDVCRRANIKVVIAGIESLEIIGSHGIKIISDEIIEKVSSDDFDMIVLPGGLPNAFTLADNEKVQSLLKEFKNKNRKIGAICAAPYALFTAGVLKNAYTCYPGFHSNITHDGYKSDDTVVVDRNITTSQGPSTAMAFALSLVEQLCSKETAQKLASDLLLA